MKGSRKWTIVVLLGMFPACTVGETPPSGEPAPPAAERPEEPAEGQPAAPGPGADAEAADLVERALNAYETADVEESLELSQRVLREFPETGAARSAAWVAARSAFALGRYQVALELSEVAAGAGGQVADEARDLSDLAQDALASPGDEPVIMGAVLPRTGSEMMVRYADWLLEGIELAVAEAETREGRAIELVVADDAGGTRTREAVAEVERRGAVAIIGPMLPEQVEEAANARSTPRLVLVSPTVPEDPTLPHVYSVNSGDTRGAREMGRYAAEAGVRYAALLYPRWTVYDQKAQAFAEEFEAAGGEIRASVPYDSGTTTFSDQMERILDAVPASLLGRDTASLSAAPTADDSLARPSGQEPFALFVAAPAAEIRQIAPQVAYYGLDAAGVQILGDEAWASGLVRRVVSAGDLEGVIAASRFMPERADGVADPDFIERYEQALRRSLENELPALGYDAANLVLQALPRRLLNPESVAMRFSLLAGLRGATGTFSVRSDRVIRTPYLVMIQDGDLVPAPLPREYRPPTGEPAAPSGAPGRP